MPGDHPLPEAEVRLVVDTLHDGCDAEPISPSTQLLRCVTAEGRPMIKNERQCKSIRCGNELRNTLGELQRTPLPEGLQPEMRELQLDALRGTLDDLQAEPAESSEA